MLEGAPGDTSDCPVMLPMLLGPGCLRFLPGYSVDQKPHIPTSFTPASCSTEDHLTIEPVDNLFRVTWDAVGIHFLSPVEIYPSIEELQKLNSSLVFHSTYGFSYGKYHEIFVEGLPESLSLKIGHAEVTIGEPTPVAAYFFDNIHDEHIYGEEWGGVSTVRILGIERHCLEAYFINACHHYSTHYDIVPRAHRFGSIEHWEDDEKEVGITTGLLPAIIDIEPLRCFYHAKHESDDASACIQFYRVLEYYAFFDLQSQVSQARHDSALSGRDFLVKVASLLTRDEKTPLIRLVQRLSSSVILKEAVSCDLIEQPDAGRLGNKLYDFRNSVVHAKYDQRSSIVVDPVFNVASKTFVWRGILEGLAWKALETCGRRDI